MSAGRRHPCRGHLVRGEIITLRTAASAVRHAIFGEKFRKVQGGLPNKDGNKLFEIWHLRYHIGQLRYHIGQLTQSLRGNRICGREVVAES